MKVRAVVVCRSMEEAGSGWTLTETLSEIAIPRDANGPFAIPARIYVAIDVDGDPAPIMLEPRLVRPNGVLLIGQEPIMINSPAEGVETIEVGLRLPLVLVPTPGVYRVIIYANGRPVGEVPLRVYDDALRTSATGKDDHFH